MPELEPFIIAIIDELSRRGASGSAFTLYHVQVNETDDGPVEVCVPSREGD